MDMNFALPAQRRLWMVASDTTRSVHDMLVQWLVQRTQLDSPTGEIEVSTLDQKRAFERKQSVAHSMYHVFGIPAVCSSGMVLSQLADTATGIVFWILVVVLLLAPVPYIVATYLDSTSVLDALRGDEETLRDARSDDEKTLVERHRDAVSSRFVVHTFCMAVYIAFVPPILVQNVLHMSGSTKSVAGIVVSLLFSSLMYYYRVPKTITGAVIATESD